MRRKKWSLYINPERTQMMELVDKVIKIIIVTLFHMLSKDMEGIKMTQTDIITIRDKKKIQ